MHHKQPELFELAWDATRDVLLGPFIERHPFERPFSWWFFDRPGGEYRQCIEGDFIPVDANAKSYWGGKWGVPPHHLLSGQPHRPVFESQLQYLTRLNLLTPAETELLRKESHAKAKV